MTPPPKGLRVPLAILVVFVGCASNVVFLELLVQFDPGCGNLITFSSFLFISVEGLVFTSRFGTVRPKIPLRAYATLVVMYFLVSVVNNYALNFDISMPLHIIFRAGSLIANMVMGVALLGKRYSVTRYLSVLCITAGIALATLASGSRDNNDGGDNEGTGRRYSWLSFALGICMLTFALLMSARMGIYQEVIYKTHGKHPKEALFFSHCLPLPGFLLLAGDIREHFGVLAASEPLAATGIPSMVACLMLNVLTQYVCISAVFVLTTECTSLTVTLVLTLRKFVSILFSIWYFQNPFTPYHWMGLALVFGGTLGFSLAGHEKVAKEKIL